MKPWDLPIIPRISPVRILTPTIYLALKDCPLRGVWSANGVSSSLPIAPKAALGMVIHKVIEGAWKGNIYSTDDFEKSWEESLQLVEANLVRSWAGRHFVPLEYSVRRYALKKELCKKTIKKILESQMRFGPLVTAQNINSCKSSNRHRLKVGQEIRLSTPSGSITGVADNIIVTENQIQIVDYKSAYWEKADSCDAHKEKFEQYCIQLFFYAALYHSQHKVWPDSLVLATIGGNEIRIPYAPREAANVLLDAKLMLSQINCLIRKSMMLSVGATMSRLAKPSHVNCRYCQYRPLCTPYWNRTVGENDNWPADLVGRIIRKGCWGDEKIFVELSLTETGKKATIIDLTPGRHPAIEENNLGVAIFSLTKGKKDDGIYKENPFTTIYCIKKRDMT